MKIVKITLLLISLSVCTPYIIGGICLALSIDVTSPIWFYIVLYSFPIQMVTYLICVFRNDSLNKEKKILWAFLVFGIGYLVDPIYWYLHIRKSKMVEYMKPQKNDRVLLLVLTLMTYVFVLAALLLVTLTEPANPPVILFGMFAFASALAAIILFVINVYHNKSIDNEQRILWTTLLILGNISIFPFYWYFHIWKQPREVLG